jgi:hypothetical protein
MKEHRRPWVAVIVLALVSPVGLYLPKIMRAGSAWGEWELVHPLGVRWDCGLWRRGISPDPMGDGGPGKAPDMNQTAREQEFLELSRMRGLRPVGRNHAELQSGRLGRDVPTRMRAESPGAGLGPCRRAHTRVRQIHEKGQREESGTKGRAEARKGPNSRRRSAASDRNPTKENSPRQAQGGTPDFPEAARKESRTPGTLASPGRDR